MGGEELTWISYNITVVVLSSDCVERAGEIPAGPAPAAPASGATRCHEPSSDAAPPGAPMEEPPVLPRSGDAAVPYAPPALLLNFATRCWYRSAAFSSAKSTSSSPVHMLPMSVFRPVWPVRNRKNQAARVALRAPRAEINSSAPGKIKRPTSGAWTSPKEIFREMGGLCGICGYSGQNTQYRTVYLYISILVCTDRTQYINIQYYKYEQYQVLVL